MLNILKAACPWALPGTAELVDLTGAAALPVSVHVLLCSVAATVTLAVILSARLAAAGLARQPVGEAMRHGYELAAAHCREHARTLPAAVGDVTTGRLPGLQLVPTPGTTYRSNGDAATAPQPVVQLSARRTPSPRHRR